MPVPGTILQLAEAPNMRRLYEPAESSGIPAWLQGGRSPKRKGMPGYSVVVETRPLGPWLWTAHAPGKYRAQDEWLEGAVVYGIGTRGTESFFTTSLNSLQLWETPQST